MLNRAPYNTEVPQFVPSRDAPINSYITRKYPCQEHLAGKENQFRTLTWKIQQPDSSMVWQSVKIVLPLEIQVSKKNGSTVSMAVNDRYPTCNLALSQSPMNAFRQTSLTINGRIFSEDNFFRDTLDACYRGVGAQAYGDNHSLKPIVHRDVHSTHHNATIPVGIIDADGDFEQTSNGGFPMVAEVASVQHRTINSAFNLLEHNGPFIERARIFQDNLSFDGKKWVGDISHLLELGPFQARARKGNTAVPYIQDFHLRLNFQNMESKFDAQNPHVFPGIRPESGRTMAPKLLEFATLANFLHKGEVLSNFDGWPSGFDFTYTAQPYLEVVYTKHESPMRDSYNLRCFEHLYEKSNRFSLETPFESFESPTFLARVTSRLLSLPTKIYVWAEISDEYKHTFAMGGVRRSCQLKNLHLRVNQRPDVMFNPSQEECYEMFRRHTNSSLEYGSWLKSPIYCFDMVDVGQPDMFSNDARITWFEWDAAVSLTELQMVEQTNLKHENYLDAMGYDRDSLETGNFRTLPGFQSTAPYLFCWIDNEKNPAIDNLDDELNVVLANKRGGHNSDRQVFGNDCQQMRFQTLLVEDSLRGGFVSSDFYVTNVENATVSIDGCVWGRCVMETHDQLAVGTILQDALFFIPNSYRFQATSLGEAFFNNLNDLTFPKGGGIHFTSKVPHVITGTLVDNDDFAAQNGKKIGQKKTGGANWCPGPFGYLVAGLGIQNNTLMTNGQGNNFPLIQEGLTQKDKWVCFGPMITKPHDSTGSNHWQMWRYSKSSDAMDAQGTPGHWGPQVAGVMNRWQYGVERLNVTMGGKWGTKDPEEFNDQDTLLSFPYGAQLVASQSAETALAERALEEDYQLKVLYEYGNCQYNFSRDGAPTRVLPNVVPVGPSPGIPLKL